MSRPPDDLLLARQRRLRDVMASFGVPALLTSDPINIVYGCGARNMTIYAMMGPSRFLLLFAEGPAILYEFAGGAHLSAGLPTVDEVRPAPGITAISGPDHVRQVLEFAAEVAAECRAAAGDEELLAVERVDFELTDALRGNGLPLRDATALFAEARRIKQPPELLAMGEAIVRVERGVGELQAAIVTGATEVEVWAELHRALIAGEGEYISTRLLQGGPNTYPYFNEAGGRPLRAGDLVCLDTDAVGVYGYAVDFSRTFLCGDAGASVRQRELHATAWEQLQHNAELLAPGRAYEEYVARSWVVPVERRASAYYCLFHGLGLSGEHPNVLRPRDGGPPPLDGELEPGMVVCVESYIGDPETHQGVKLEDQYLITDTGTERLTSYPFDPALA